MRKEQKTTEEKNKNACYSAVTDQKGRDIKRNPRKEGGDVRVILSSKLGVSLRYLSGKVDGFSDEDTYIKWALTDGDQVLCETGEEWYETIPMLKKAVGVDCLSDRPIFRWYKAFAEGREDVNDESRPDGHQPPVRRQCET
ncbi:hypothetical protein NQ318_011321, partial [Aromia moschata]